jgi:prophage regulatory protein
MLPDVKIMCHSITRRHTEMKYLSDKHLAERYEVARATIWRWVRESSFPSPVKISKGCTRWKLSEIEAWEAAR